MNNQDPTQTDLKNQVQPTRVVTFSWFDNGFCPDQYLANLIERYNSAVKPFSEGILAFKAATKLVEGNAGDVRITSFHGLIDLDRDLYPVLTNARAANEQVFSKAAFSLQDMGMDSGDKLSCLREYIRFVQQTWALPGLYIGLSMHMVREIAS